MTWPAIEPSKPWPHPKDEWRARTIHALRRLLSWHEKQDGARSKRRVMRSSRGVLVGWICCGGLALLAVAAAVDAAVDARAETLESTNPPPSTTPSKVPEPVMFSATVHRSDLARAYLLLEDALVRHAPTPQARQAINREVDALSLAFFSGRMGEALARLNELTTTVLGLRGEAQADFFNLASHRGAIDDGVLLRGAPSEVRVHVESMVPGLMLPSSTMLIVTTPDGATRSQPFRGRSAVVRLSDQPALEPGRYRLALATKAMTAPVPLRTIDVVGEFPTNLAARLSSRLDCLDAAGVTREQDRVATRARLRLLDPGDEAASARNAASLLDRNALARELVHEVTTLEEGGSPWVGRTGDMWRTIRARSIEIPLRVFVPERRPPDAEKLPLVIALHGAGGDENMFFEGYGQGLLVALAREHGFVVAAPTSAPFLLAPQCIDAVIDEMVACHDIDRDRVIILGHSMGAASRMAHLRGDELAGVALIAGGTPPDAARPPTRMFAGALDALAPIGQFRSAVAKAKAAGAIVELVEYPDDGHLLVVTSSLRDAVIWLLAQRRTPS